MQLTLYKNFAIWPLLLFISMAIFSSADSNQNIPVMFLMFAALALGNVGSYKSLVLSKRIFARSFFTALTFIYSSVILFIFGYHALRLWQQI